MPHNRAPKKGAKYYLPKYEFKTVVSFCLQYPELKQKLRTFNGFHAIVNDGMPHGNTTSDPTANDALMRSEIQAKIDLIEQTIKKETGILYPWMIQGITDEKITYDMLRAQGMPLNRNEYSLIRRKVYFAISKHL